MNPPKITTTNTISAIPLPAAVAAQEIQFFLSRLVQDLVEQEPEPEIPPGEEPPKG